MGTSEVTSWQARLLGLGVSRAALDVYLASEVIDLHVESFSFTRSFGYDLRRRHDVGWNRAFLFGQADLPRLAEAHVGGGIWSITANPLRPPDSRADAFRGQIRELERLFAESPAPASIVRSLGEYRSARARGHHAGFLGVQGANALPPDPEFLAEIAPWLVKICLLHLTTSSVGTTSTFRDWPNWLGFGSPGLGALGVEFVRRMNHERILVDLAHIHPTAFWEAARHADPAVPLVVSHTGVSGVHPHWRNLDDAQIRLVAERNGTIGIIYHAEFLGDPIFRGRVDTVARHVAHVIDLVGDEHVSLGSDWDGLICPPRDMPTCLELPRLVQALLDRGVSETSLPKILGGNFLRVLADLDRDGLVGSSAS